MSSAVDCITYKISSVVKEVHVAPCGSLFTGQPDALRIGSLSTYCGVKTYARDRRPQGKLRTSYKITHAEGCYFDFNDDIPAARRLLGQPAMAPDMTQQELDAIRDRVVELQDDIASGPPEPNPGRDNPVSSPNPSTGQTNTWWEKWNALVALTVG